MAHETRSPTRITTLALLVGGLLATATGCQERDAATLSGLSLPTVTLPEVAATETCSPPAEAHIAPLDAPLASTVALAKLGDRVLAYVADSDERAIIAVDLDTERELSRVDLAGTPEQLLVTPDGRVAVSVADRAEVVLLDADVAGQLSRGCGAEVAAEPAGLAIAGDSLLVASRWGAKLTSLRLRDLEREWDVPLERDPYAVTVVDGHAYVSHVVMGRVSRIDLATRGTQVLSTVREDHKTSSSLGMMPMPMDFHSQQALGPQRRVVPSRKVDRIATQGFALVATDDGRVLGPVSLAEPSPPVNGGGGYGGTGPEFDPHQGVTVVIEGEKVSIPRGAARSLATDCLLPRGASWDGENRLLWVACRGIDQVVGFEFGDGPQDMRRVSFAVGSGPSGVALDRDGRRLVVWSQFDGSLSIATPTRSGGDHRDGVTSIPLKRSVALAADIALGRRIFHEAGPKRRIAADGRACASCHPSGRDDGLTWHTQEGPRQTPILMSRIAGTEPFGWNGLKEDIDSHLQRTLERLRGVGLKDHERAALVAYIGTMTPPNDDTLAGDTQTDAGAGPGGTTGADDGRQALAKRGAELFHSDETGCASCHGGIGTDGLAHDVGSRHSRDMVATFDTPTLRHIGQSAPYFHDGRYATLEELLADPDSRMGHSSQLSERDRSALGAYLRTL